MATGAIPGFISEQTGTDRFKAATLPSPPIQVTQAKYEDEFLEDAPVSGSHFATDLSFPTPSPRRTFSGSTPKTMTDDFFEEVYLLPRSIDAGIILSVRVFTIDIYNAYRTATRTWTAFDASSLGSGVEFSTPVPPSNIDLGPQQGETRTLTIQTEGTPTINGTLDFTFDVPGELTIPVTGQRTVLFPFEPEAPLIERLVFATDVIKSLSGKEFRRSLRDMPRIEYEYDLLADANERRLLNNLLFDGQSRAFGVCVWTDATKLSADVAVNDTVINVDSTSFADYRTGGLAVVWQDAFNFEALQIDSFTSTTITFASPFTTAFSDGATVMPVQTAVGTRSIAGGRFINNLQRNRMKFIVLDNDRDIADTSAFNTFTPPISTNNPNPVERVLLDNPNYMTGQDISEDWVKTIEVVDGRIGTLEVSSDATASQHTSNKGFITSNRSDLFDIRKLLYALRGRFKGFYLPTFFPDFEPAADIGATDQAIDVDYTSFNDSIGPDRLGRTIVRVHKTDGTMSDPLVITGTSEPSAGVERLSFAPVQVGISATMAEISRIELIEKVRFNSDKQVIRHTNSLGDASIVTPVITLLEEDDVS